MATGLALMSRGAHDFRDGMDRRQADGGDQASPGFSEMGGYDRKVASNHQDSSVPSFRRESKPLLPFAVGRFTHRSVQVRRGGCRWRVDGGDGNWADDIVVAVHKLTDGDRLTEGPGDAVFRNRVRGTGRCGRCRRCWRAESDRCLSGFRGIGDARCGDQEGARGGPCGEKPRGGNRAACRRPSNTSV